MTVQGLRLLHFTVYGTSASDGVITADVDVELIPEDPE
jgi:hypothetical protein